jgi:uncharacterized protein (DUF1501 family)
MDTTRRELLRAGALSALGLGLSGPLEALAAASPRGRSAGDPVVVVVTLNGGNDGLNTVVPLRQYGRYREMRPTLAWRREVLIPVHDYDFDFALNPGMRAIAGLFGRGKVAIVNGCSTPPTARGLFDHEASLVNCWTGELYGTAPAETPTGWLGRYLDAVEPDVLPAGFDLGSTPLVLTGARGVPLSLYGLSNFGVYPSVDSEARYAAYGRIQQAPAATGPGREGQALRRQIGDLTGVLAEIASTYRVAPGVTYPPTYLAANLQDCAALILADRGVRALSVSLSGFDTHATQNETPPGGTPLHQGLLTIVSEAIAAFHEDLSRQGAGRRVLTLVVSEFGRRPFENADRGTDHGLAGPIFAIGDAVRGGVYGDHPDLRDEYLVLGGNLDLRVDFRSVYATVLAQHLGVDPGPILRGDFPLVEFL